MKRQALLAAVLALVAGTAFALEFRSVKETGVALYDAPNLSAQKLFVVSRYFPVEVLATQKDWSRVRDATGGIAWIPSAALSTRRTLLVTADKLAVRDTADDKARVLFWAEKRPGAGYGRSAAKQLGQAQASRWQQRLRPHQRPLGPVREAS